MSISRLVMLAIFLGSCLSVEAQLKGYIIKDKTYTQGIVKVLGDGRIKFRERKDGTPQIYSQNELKGYGYGEDVFEAFVVNGRRIFLKQVVAGKAHLFKRDSIFLLKIDSTTILLSDSTYQAVVSKMLPCPQGEKILDRLPYSTFALKNYINLHNKGRCFTDLPVRSFGGYLGYQSLHVNLNFIGSNSFSQNSNALTAGFYCDFPIAYKRHSIFLTTEINWFYAKPLLYTESTTNTYVTRLGINAVSGILAAKWILQKNKVTSYVKTGLVVSSVNINSPTGWVKTTTQDSTITISKQSIPPFSSVLLGANVGLGLMIPYHVRNNFSLELRYMKTLSNKINNLQLALSGISLTAGYTFY